jgi:ABC-type transporter Mla subunit MlaD
MCALELQDTVDTLHSDLVHTTQDERASAQRILALEASLDGLGTEGLAPEAMRARQDRLTFEERSESTALTLLRGRHELIQRELEPTRQLRDTVMKLHDEMSGFVMQANSAVDTAGRRIQALGMAADAPMVVAELHASLENLSDAMQATELYVEAAQDLVTRVLPDLSARLAAQQDVQGDLDAAALEGLDRARARALADQALRDAADAEVDALTAPLS